MSSTMDAKKFESIKSQIEKAKESRNKAEGGIARIMSELKKNYKIESIEEINELLKSKKDELKEIDSKLTTLYSKLDKIADWDEL